MNDHYSRQDNAEKTTIEAGIKSEAIFRAPDGMSTLSKKIMDKLIADIPNDNSGLYYIAALDKMSKSDQHDIFIILGPQTNGFILLGISDNGKTSDDLKKIAITTRDAAVRGLPAYVDGMNMSEGDKENQMFRISSVLMTSYDLLGRNFWKTNFSYGLPPNDVERKWVFVCPEAFLPLYVPAITAQNRHVYEPKTELEWKRIIELCSIALESASKGLPFCFGNGIEMRPDEFVGRGELLPMFLLSAVIHWRWGKLVSGGTSFLIGLKTEDMIEDETIETFLGFYLTGFDASNMGLAMMILGDLVRRNRIMLDDGREVINGANILFKPMKWLEEGGYYTGRLRMFIGMDEEYA